MNITISPTKVQYLEQVSAGLADLPEEEREEVLQDLSAHLAELDDDQIVSVLGTPEGFVAEFRASAGLDQPGRVAGVVGRARIRLENWSIRLSDLTNWPQLRPLWVWTRGWIVLSVFATNQGDVAFYHFPIPAVGGRTLIGLLLVVAATWFSVWLDQQPKGRARDSASVVFSALGIWALAAGILGGVALGYPAQFVDYQADAELYEYPIFGQEGDPVTNIYAYDTDGNPVEVLLLDQLGRPVLVMPPWVYEEAERRPGETAVEYPGGYVTFSRDEFGRIIPNLYPLELETYNDWGELEPTQPPGAWSVPGEEGPGDTPPTTTSERLEE